MSGSDACWKLELRNITKHDSNFSRKLTRLIHAGKPIQRYRRGEYLIYDPFLLERVREMLGSVATKSRADEELYSLEKLNHVPPLDPGARTSFPGGLPGSPAFTSWGTMGTGRPSEPAEASSSVETPDVVEKGQVVARGYKFLHALFTDIQEEPAVIQAFKARISRLGLDVGAASEQLAHWHETAQALLE